MHDLEEEEEEEEGWIQEVGKVGFVRLDGRDAMFFQGKKSSQGEELSFLSILTLLHG